MRTPRFARLFPVTVTLATTTTLAATGALVPAAAAAPMFRWSEATVEQVSQALTSGELTCRDLVAGYLARIAAYDRRGPRLNSYLTINPAAIAEADALDDRDRPDRGRLFCVPLVVKDNVQVEGMPTTAGATALAGARPPGDAFVVQRLRAQGALVLGKGNLDEFAFGFAGRSSVGGQVRNPYDLTRGPGGSSSGTAAAVAASLALAGLGTDTGGSVRVPSSVHALVGIRPSMRLLSQSGIVPLSAFQDTVGPMCRVVQDCARLLEVLAAYDPAATSGQYTLPQQRDDTGVLLSSAQAYRATVGVGPRAYTRALRPQGLRRARIGVVPALFGTDPDVQEVLAAAIARMRAAGATVEEVSIPDLEVITTRYTSLSAYEFRDQLTRYLQSWPSDEDDHPRSFEEVAARAAPSRAATFSSYATTGTDRYADPLYQRNTLERPGYVRPRLLAALDHEELDGTVRGRPYDALLYPSVTSLPRVGAAPTTGSNNRLSPFSGFPALSMPAGFTAATDARPALPVGMELLGREFDEATLLRLAFGYQSAVAGTSLARQAPPTTPELVRSRTPARASR